MKSTHRCPKCGSGDVIRVPGNAHRYLANSICITRFAWVRRIPVDRFVCSDCGYVENWVADRDGLKKIKQAYQGL